MRYGLIGRSLEHSFSQDFFTRKFEQEGIDARYTSFEMEDLHGIVELVERESLDGFNVTIPYKQEIIAYLHELSPEAEQIGAVNCVRIVDGKWIGYNTDHQAFADSLQPYLPGIRKALILGTGGAAKAVHYALEQLGVKHRNVSRKGTLDYRHLGAEQVRDSQLIVQATPLGMGKEIGNAPTIPYDALGPDQLAYDLIYNPHKTLFLQIAEIHGAMIINGLDMLERQALLSWDIWQA